MTTRRREDLRSLMVLVGALFVARVLVKAGLPSTGGMSMESAPVPIGGFVLLWALAIVVFVPGLNLSEEASRKWGHRPWIYAAVVLNLSAAVSSITVPLCDALGLEPPFWLHPGSEVSPHLVAFLDVAMRAGLAAFIYASHRQRLAAARTVRELKSQQTEVLAGLTESKLRTARARIRPEAFIEELRALRRTYLVDAQSAESRMEEMIGRLRAASRGSPA